VTTTASGGLSLYDAARVMGVPFTKEVVPTDKEVRVENFKFHYLDWGNESKPPLVLFHGRTNGAHTWDFTSLACYDDFHVIALDMPGHGDTDWIPGRDYTPDFTVPLATAFVNAVGLKQFYLLGHSMGARIAMIYASQNPDNIKCLVMVDMAPETTRGDPVGGGWRALPQETDSFEEFVQAAHKVNPRRSPEQLRGSLAHQLRQFPSGKWSWKWDPALREADTIGWSKERLWAAAEKVKKPFLIVRGGESGMVAQHVLDRFAAMNPQFRSVDIAGAGHQVHGDRPAPFIKAVKEFLSTVK